MNVVNNYKELNLENEQKDDASIYNTYKKLFKLRKDLNIANGKMDFIDIESKDSYIYTNKVDTSTLLVIANFRSNEINVRLDIDLDNFEYFMGNSNERSVQNNMTLSPYETMIYIKK